MFTMYLNYLNSDEYSKVTTDIIWVSGRKQQNRKCDLKLNRAMQNIINNAEHQDSRIQLMNLIILAAI